MSPSKPSARPITPISSARATRPADTATRSRPCTARRPPDMNARLTPATTTKVATERPAATTVAALGSPRSVKASNEWVAIIPSRAVPRATSTPVMRAAGTLASGVAVGIGSGRRQVGDPYRIRHADDHLARAGVGLAAVRRPDVVDQHQVAGPPRLADRVGPVNVVEQRHHVVADRVTPSVAGAERQPVLPVHLDQVLPQVRRERPLAEKGDLVEPAAPAGDRVPHHRGASLPRA